MTLQNVNNKQATTTLDGGITDVATSLTSLDDATTAGFPAAPFPCLIDSELVNVTSIGTGKNWTIERAYGGTTGAAHSSGADVDFKVTAEWFTEVNNRVIGAERYEANDATDTLSSASRAIVTKDVGDPPTGWYNVFGSAYCQNANPGTVSLDVSDDDASSWTTLDAQGIHNLSGEYVYFHDWVYYDADTGTGLHARIYVVTEGSAVRFELSADNRWQAEVRVVGPFNGSAPA